MKTFQTSTLILLLSLTACMAQEGKLISFKAYNNITFEYEIILPENYADEGQYEMAFVFSETAKIDDTWEESMGIINHAVRMKNTILVIPKVPLKNEHWKSHPIHHALNDLMDDLREKYGEKGQKFHFIGYKSGQDVAQTYSSMSSEYVKSYSIIHGEYWGKNKQEWFNNVLNRRIPVYVYENKSQDEIPLNISKTTFDKSGDLSEALQKIDNKIRQI